MLKMSVLGASWCNLVAMARKLQKLVSGGLLVPFGGRGTKVIESAFREWPSTLQVLSSSVFLLESCFVWECARSAHLRDGASGRHGDWFELGSQAQ